jgi:AFG1-like ATPase
MRVHLQVRSKLPHVVFGADQRMALRSRHPDELYKNGIQRASFLPAIDLLKSEFDVTDLNSGTGPLLVPYSVSPNCISPSCRLPPTIPGTFERLLFTPE